MRARKLTAAVLLLALASVLSCGGPAALSGSSSRLVAAQVVPATGGFSVMQQLLAFNAPACLVDADCNPTKNTNLVNYPAPPCSEYFETCSKHDGTPGWCVLRLQAGAECLPGMTWNCTTSANLGIYTCGSNCTWDATGCKQCGGRNQACCPLPTGPTCTALLTHCNAAKTTFPTGVCER